jgi:anti-anti-sigma regulatory factor
MSTTNDPGASELTVLALEGECGLADAERIREDMLRALAAGGAGVRLDLSAVTGVDALFFQMLFSLAAQAGMEGKRVVLDMPLPAPLAKAADELGFSRHDFERTFSPGAMQ